MSKKTLIILIVVLCLVVGAGVGAYFYLFQNKYKEVSQEEAIPSQEETQQEEPSQEQAAAEEEIPPLPEYIEEGEATFNVSGGKTYPKFKSGKWSKRPDFIVGGVDSELEAGIKVEDPDGVSKVWLVVSGYKDTKKEVSLKLTEGDSHLGTWSTKFAIPEEMKRIFETNFYAKNNKGKEEVLDLGWRNNSTCPYGMTGNKTYTSCEISSDEEGGTVSGYVNVTGTVNLHGTAGHPAYLIFGTKVTFGGGKIVMYGSTSSIIIKAGRTDSVHGKVAAICAYSASGKSRCGGTHYRCTGTGGQNYSWVQACGSRGASCGNCGGCNYWCVYADYGYPSGYDGASATGCGQTNCALNKCELLDSWRGCTGFCPEDSCYVSHDWGHSEYVNCCCYKNTPSYSCTAPMTTTYGVNGCNCKNNPPSCPDYTNGNSLCQFFGYDGCTNTCPELHGTGGHEWYCDCGTWQNRDCASGKAKSSICNTSCGNWNVQLKLCCYNYTYD